MTLKHQELNDQVYQAIESLILEGALKPGDRIYQDQLSEQLGVSRISLLKALQRLESELLVEKRPRSGVFVRKVEAQELVDAFESRVGIESVAVRLAAERITASEVQQLRDLFVPFTDEPEHGDIRDFTRADREFHKAIIRLSGNAILRKFDMVANLLYLMFQHFEYAIAVPLQEHYRIIDALEIHDASLAEQLMREHITNNTLKVSQDAIMIAG
jgi:DNA-binding GntR family transcriptional regulator